MQTTNCICIIIPYFGKWPKYMQLYLSGCRRNPTIDFLFFTDAGHVENCPDNVKINSYSLHDFNKLVSDTFNLTSKIDSAYKVCDIRPAFAHIFKDYLAKYTFWGWGDIDLIYGDLSMISNANFLKRYDVISGRKFWLSGAFCLLKNNNNVNSIFLKNDDYKEVFTNKLHVSYGECGKKWRELISGKSIFDIDFDIKNFTFSIFEMQRSGNINISFDDKIAESIQKKGYIKIQNGKVFNQDGKEFALFHYVIAKRNAWYFYPDWRVIPDEFYITETGFYTTKEFHSKFFSFRSYWRKIRVLHLVFNNYYKRVANKLHLLLKRQLVLHTDPCA